MSDDAIRKALEVSANALEASLHNARITKAGEFHIPDAAAAIAAFLEALPGLSALPAPDGGLVGIKVDRMRALATAVRRAAGGG